MRWSACMRKEEAASLWLSDELSSRVWSPISSMVVDMAASGALHSLGYCHVVRTSGQALRKSASERLTVWG